MDPGYGWHFPQVRKLWLYEAFERVEGARVCRFCRVQITSPNPSVRKKHREFVPASGRQLLVRLIPLMK